MHLIVGLGNPGSKYADTRHNVGYRVVDRLAVRWGVSVDKRKFEGRAGGGTFRDQPVLLVKPETFMNLSGISVRAAMDFYKVEPSNLIVILDDLALPTGQIRVRPQGSAGGHNGLADVILRAGTDRICRVRIGIGQPPPMLDAVEYVLSTFRSEEKPAMETAVGEAAEAVEAILGLGVAKTMDRYNRPKDSNPEPPKTNER